MYGIDQRVRQPAPTAQVTARDPAGILMYDCVQSMSNSICLAWTELVSVLASSLYIKTRLTSLNMQGMSGLYSKWHLPVRPIGVLEEMCKCNHIAVTELD